MYYVTAGGLDTTSLAGEASAFNAISFEGDPGFDRLPDSAFELGGIYYDAVGDVAVDLSLPCNFILGLGVDCAKRYIDLGGGAYSLRYEYAAYAGDRRGTAFVDGVPEDIIVDKEDSRTAIGSVVVRVDRASALQGDDDAASPIAGVARLAMVDADGFEVGAARLAMLEGEPALRFTLADPLHPGSELLLALPAGDAGPRIAVIAARGARNSLQARMAGPLALEGELGLLDVEEPRVWRIGAQSHGD